MGFLRQLSRCKKSVPGFCHYSSLDRRFLMRLVNAHFGFGRRLGLSTTFLSFSFILTVILADTQSLHPHTLSRRCRPSQEVAAGWRHSRGRRGKIQANGTELRRFLSSRIFSQFLSRTLALLHGSLESVATGDGPLYYYTHVNENITTTLQQPLPLKNKYL